jgi:Putative addiction module component
METPISINNISQFVALFRQLKQSDKFNVLEQIEPDIFEFIKQEKHSHSITDGQKTELKRRLELLENGEMKAYDWDEIKGKYGV